jgi:IPT/TIG domain
MMWDAPRGRTTRLATLAMTAALVGLALATSATAATTTTTTTTTTAAPPAVTITSVTPTSGASGSVVTILFTDASNTSTGPYNANFGSTSVPIVDMSGSTGTLTGGYTAYVTVPAGSGSVPLTVTDTTTGAKSGAVTFTYTAATTTTTTTGPALPVIDSIYGTSTGGPPYSYPDAVSGDTIYITGANFTAGMTVTVDGITVPATGDVGPYTYVGVGTLDTMTATVPANIPPGLYDVQVTTSVGKSAVAGVNKCLPYSEYGYTWTCDALVIRHTTPVALGSITPNQGPLAGGNSVTLNVANADLDSSVYYGPAAWPASLNCGGLCSMPIGTPATVTGRTANTITVTAPPQTAYGNPLYFIVVNDDQSTGSAQYTYVPPPTVTGVTPNQGTVSGGTGVTITGTNFTAGSTVKFGTSAATGVIVKSSTSISAVAPAASLAGPVDVIVTSAGGTSSTGSADQYKYVANVSDALFTNDFTPGGNVTQIDGQGFTANTQVAFGSQQASKVVVVSPTEVQATSPATNVGSVPLEVTTGGSTVTAGQETYYAVPPNVAMPAALPSGASYTEQALWDMEVLMSTSGSLNNTSNTSYLDGGGGDENLMRALVIVAIKSGGASVVPQLVSMANNSTLLSAALLWFNTVYGSSYGGGSGQYTVDNGGASTAGGPNGCHGVVESNYYYNLPFNTTAVQIKAHNDGWCWIGNQITQNGWSNYAQYYLINIGGVSPYCWAHQAQDAGPDGLSGTWSHAIVSGVWTFHKGPVCIDPGNLLDSSYDWNHVELRISAGSSSHPSGYWDKFDDWPYGFDGNF